MDKIPVSFSHSGIFYEGYLKTLGNNTWHVILNSQYMGNLIYEGEWRLENHPDMADFLGDVVIAWIQ